MDLKPFDLPHKLLLGAGPSNCSARVLRALSFQTLSPVAAHTNMLIDETREMLKQVFVTTNELTLVQQTSGSGGLETVVLNILESGQKILVAVLGVWGDRVADIARRNDIEVVKLSIPLGEVYSFDLLESEIKKHKPALLFVTHGETSTGVLQPLIGLADICHRYNCLLAVDAIITLGSEPLYVDDWKLDIVVGATQKAIGAPPGLALLTFSALAEKIIKERKTPVPLYFDVKGLAFNWNCYGERGYYYTYSTNMIAGLREALAEKLEEGLENVWKRHKNVGEYLWMKMDSIGIKHLICKKENRLHTVAVYGLPDDIKWPVLLEHMYERHNMDISYGIGPTSNKGIRLGLMGINSKKGMVDYITQKLIEGMDFVRTNKLKGPEEKPDNIFK